MSWIEDPGEFEGVNFTKLKVDQAFLKAYAGRQAWLYTRSDECYKCPFTRFSDERISDSEYIIDTIYKTTWRIRTNGFEKYDYTDTCNRTNYCLHQIRPELGEFGVYKLNVTDTDHGFEVLKQPVNIYLPILIAFFCLMGIFALKMSYTLIRRKYFKNTSSLDEKPTNKRRIRALDTFRGLSIVLMIFVNDGAGRYWWLEHAVWNGLTVADLVFPFFLWIMGVCIPISVKSLNSKNVPKYESLLNIFTRSCKLFLIGLSLGSLSAPILYEIRIFGVLQRFGVSYFFVASMVVLMTQKWKGESENKYKAAFQDILTLGWQWLIMLVLITIHLVFVFTLPVPNCETGYLGPGGLHENGKNKDCIGGATKYIDVLILGDNHLYQNPTAKFIYESGSFDPEGIFGCILSIVHVFFGVQAGNTLLYFQETKQLISRWLTWAVVTGLVGGALCNFSQEDGVIPVNKNLWSLSFVLVTSSFAFILLSVCYILIDVKKWWSGSPFIQPGMNSIVMYAGHTICYVIFPFHWRVTVMKTHFVFLMEALWGTILWIVVAYVMVKKKVFITI